MAIRLTRKTPGEGARGSGEDGSAPERCSRAGSGERTPSSGTALRMGAADTFVLVITSLVRIVEILIRRFAPTLFRELG